MNEIEFVDEPPRSNGRWDRAAKEEVIEFAEQLKANPGKWAVYPWASTPDSARGKASRISRGQLKAFPEGFRAVSRNGTVYVRYDHPNGEG